LTQREDAVSRKRSYAWLSWKTGHEPWWGQLPTTNCVAFVWAEV